MANRTVKEAHSVKGTNPQYLVEKIIRTRIYESRYWKENCFAVSAELLVDKAMGLKYVGGVFGGNIKITPFLCLVLKMLQIQPEKDIVIEFITQQDFKYVRALGAVYMRLTGNSLDCYKYLEPLYLDYRKMKKINSMGGFQLLHMDEFIDELLTEERVCDVILPRIQKRHVLEETNKLEPRPNTLDDDMDLDSDEEDYMADSKGADRGRPRSLSPEKKDGYRDYDRPVRGSSPRYHRSKSRSPKRRRSSSRDRETHRHHRSEHHEHDRERRRDRHRRHSRSRSRDREHKHKSSSHKHRHEDGESRHHRHHSSKKSRKEPHGEEHGGQGGGNLSKEQREIMEANELRAKLGMAPLRP